MKAYYVNDYSEEHGAIVFAETPGKAKSNTDLDCDFVDKKVRREPKYDKYADCGVPVDVLFGDGWWFSCDTPKCYEYHVTQDNGGMVIDGKVYCTKCAEQKAKAGQSNED